MPGTSRVSRPRGRFPLVSACHAGVICTHSRVVSRKNEKLTHPDIAPTLNTKGYTKLRQTRNIKLHYGRRSLPYDPAANLTARVSPAVLQTPWVFSEFTLEARSTAARHHISPAFAEQLPSHISEVAINTTQRWTNLTVQSLFPTTTY